MMSFETEHAKWIHWHLSRRTGERKRRTEAGVWLMETNCLQRRSGGRHTTNSNSPISGCKS